MVDKHTCSGTACSGYFDFDGESCGDYDDANEDVMLFFRDVFGHEAFGGWERYTYDEIDSAAEFLDGTCLLYIEGLCDTTTFQNFYNTYRDNIENYVEFGGKLQVNTVTAERYYIGFDSIYISKSMPRVFPMFIQVSIDC